MSDSPHVIGGLQSSTSNIKRITINGNILKAVAAEHLEEQKEEEPLPSPQWRQDHL